MKQQAAHSHEDKLLDFAYGELPEAEARGVEAHLEGCTRCAAELDSIRGVRRTMSLLDDAPAPDAGLESLMAYAQQTARRIQAGPSAPQTKWRRWMFSFAGAASLLVVGIVGVQVSKELDVQARAEQAAVKASADAVAAPPPAAPMAEAAPGAATQLGERASEGGLAREAAKVMPPFPEKKGVVAEDRAARSDGYRPETLAEKAGRIAEPSRKRKAEFDRKDYMQGPPRGTGLGSAGGSVVGGAPSGFTRDEGASAPADLDSAKNYVEGARPPSAARREAKGASPEPKEQSRLSLEASPPPAPVVAEEEAGADEVDEEVALDDARASPPKPTTQAVAAPAAPASPRRAAPTAQQYERQAELARKKGDRAGEIQALRNAVSLTGAGAQQIGLLSRLCEVELAAGLHQPTSCHRLATEYPTHNAGILARRRLESQQQHGPASADPAQKQ